jgi:hypothetical protein
MLEKYRTEESIWHWRWPIIVVVVLLVLFGIQMMRVNMRPTLPISAPETRTYATSGPLVSGEIIIPAADYYAKRIDLNRRAKISGEFRTGDIKSRVSVLVMGENDFENWKLDSNYDAVAQTGYVPGGKIIHVLEAGAYFLIIDNRRNDTGRSVHADFALE